MSRKLVSHLLKIERPLTENNNCDAASTSEAEKFWWGETRGSTIEKNLLHIYENAAKWILWKGVHSQNDKSAEFMVIKVLHSKKIAL